jgi:putative sigma-54 modulation protein
MEIKVLGKEIKVTEAIKDYVERKLDRVDKYFENSSAEVTIRAEKNEQIAEVLVTANGEKYRAEAEEKDLYASIDKVIDILEGQIRKTKTKRERLNKEATIRASQEEEQTEPENEIIKELYYEIKPMTPEDAKLKLQENKGNTFLTFVNLENGKVNVVYKLKDNKNYGLIEPEA